MVPSLVVEAGHTGDGAGSPSGIATIATLHSALAALATDDGEVEASSTSSTPAEVKVVRIVILSWIGTSTIGSQIVGSLLSES